jgi:hypothetical protein
MQANSTVKNESRLTFVALLPEVPDGTRPSD